MGSTNIAAVLLKMDNGWDWFITLSATDYPLIMPDDLSHVFSSVSRDLNLIDHISDLGWKEVQRIRPIVVDPGTYLARKTQIFYATEKRPMPGAFKVFTGSPWVILSRSFLEYCVFGWENLPRTLLLFFTNTILSQEVYFHTVICNAPEFKNTTLNGDLRYLVWDNPRKWNPFSSTSQITNKWYRVVLLLLDSLDDVLDMIDKNILKRGRNRGTQGAWCSGQKNWLMDPCSQWDNVNLVKPGPQAEILQESLNKLLHEWKSQSNRCR